MNNQIHNRELPSVKKFIKDNQLSWWIIGLIVLLGYGIKLGTINFSHDTEAIMQVGENFYTSWLSMGRYGLVLLKILMGTYTFNPYVAVFGTVVMMMANAILWEYIFYWIASEKRREKFHLVSWIFPAFYCSSMVIAEYSAFILQSFELNVVFFLLGISFLVLLEVFINGKSKLFLIPVVAVLSICFSSYQSFVPFFCGGTALLFLMIYDRQAQDGDENHEMKWYFFFLVKMVVVFLLSLVIYVITNKIVLHVLGIETTSYITNQISWGTYPAAGCIKNICYYIYSVLLGKKIYYTCAYLAVYILALICLGSKVVSRQKAWLLYVVAGVFSLVTPFMLAAFVGDAPTARTSIVVPFVAGVWFQYLMFQLIEMQRSILKTAACRRVFHSLCAVVILVICINQAEHVSKLYYTEYTQRKYDASVALKISERIDALNLGENPSEPVVFVGNLSGSQQLGIYSAEELECSGISYFYISFGTVHGTWVMTHYMQTQGYKINMDAFPSNEVAAEAETLSEDMPSWPDEGSVALKDGIIIVHLGEVTH